MAASDPRGEHLKQMWDDLSGLSQRTLRKAPKPDPNDLDKSAAMLMAVSQMAATAAERCTQLSAQLLDELEDDDE